MAMGPKKGSSPVPESYYLPLKWILSRAGEIPQFVEGWVDEVDPELLIYVLAMTAVRTRLEYRHEVMTPRGYYLIMGPEELRSMFNALGSPFEKTPRGGEIRVGLKNWWAWLLKQGMIPDSKEDPFPANHTNERLLSNLGRIAELIRRGGEHTFRKYVDRANLFRPILPPVDTRFPRVPPVPKGAYNPLKADWESLRAGTTYCFVEAVWGEIDERTLAKVGFTTRKVTKRLNELHTANTHLRVYKVLPSYLATEQYLHRVLAATRVKISNTIPFSDGKPEKKSEKESEFFEFSAAKAVFDNVAEAYGLAEP